MLDKIAANCCASSIRGGKGVLGTGLVACNKTQPIMHLARALRCSLHVGNEVGLAAAVRFLDMRGNVSACKQ